MQESYVQNYQALKFCKDLQKPSMEDLKDKMVELEELKDPSNYFL